MYNEFKNKFISEMYSIDINLNGNQMGKILTTLDKTSEHYDIFSKSQLKCYERGMPLLDISRLLGHSKVIQL